MTCPHCGAEVPAGNRFCPQCRKRVGTAPASRPAPRTPVPRYTGAGAGAAGGPAPAGFSRPTVITILGVLDLLGCVLALAAGAVMLFGGLAGGDEGAVGVLAIGAAYGLVGACQLAAGIGLLGLKPWARPLQIGLAVLGLLGIPCGTIISILILVYMLKPEVRILFSGVSPSRLAPEEVAMVQRLSEGSGATVVIVAVVVVFAGIVMVGIIAAIAIPSLLRARVAANESSAIGDLRSMISAQETYAASNYGLYDTPACLTQPSSCIPGYPTTSPRFLDAERFGRETRSGYVFAFHPGPPAPPPQVPGAQPSPSSLDGWAYTATPTTQDQTGVRAFCADASGAICSDLDGRLGDVSAGTCPADCVPLR